VQSPTFRDAPIDYGDLVLWDGAPVAAHKTLDQETVPVFPLLEILRRGDERRWPFIALEREPGSVRSLEADLPEGARLFVQKERVEHHCAACEAGEPHRHGDGDVTAATGSAVATLVRGKLIVPRAQDLSELRSAWETAIGTRPLSIALPALYEELGDSKQAGQAHQAWRGIEGKALRRKAQA